MGRTLWAAKLAVMGALGAALGACGSPLPATSAGEADSSTAVVPDVASDAVGDDGQASAETADSGAPPDVAADSDADASTGNADDAQDSSGGPDADAETSAPDALAMDAISEVSPDADVEDGNAEDGDGAGSDAADSAAGADSADSDGIPSPEVSDTVADPPDGTQDLGQPDMPGSDAGTADVQIADALYPDLQDDDAQTSDVPTDDVADAAAPNDAQVPSDTAMTDGASVPDVALPDSTEADSTPTDLSDGSDPDAPTLDSTTPDAAPAQPALSLVSGGKQSAWLDDDLPEPVVLRLDGADGLPVAGVTVTMTAPPGAVATPASAATNSQGLVSFQLRLNLAVGTDLAFTAQAATGPALAVTASAIAPPNGTLFAAVGRDPPAGASLYGPGTVAQSEWIRDFAVAADGTVYFTQSAFGGTSGCRVTKLSPLGEVSLVAGTGICVFAGDGGPAVDACLAQPRGLALDEATHSLFVAETGSSRVRRIDLISGMIQTYVGGGQAYAAPYGDGGSGLKATLAAPSHLFWGPAPVPLLGNALYISDDGHKRVRMVDSGGVIHTWLAPQIGNCAVDPLIFVDCAGGCHVVWDAEDQPFVAGRFCGTAVGTPGGTFATALARMDGVGSLHHVGGVYTYLPQDGIQARSAMLDIDALALDSGGNFLLASPGTQRIRRIDGRTGLVTTVAGQIGKYDQSGSYVPGELAGIQEPHALALGPLGQLLIGDGAQLRVIWAAGTDLPSDVSLVDAAVTPPTALPAGPVTGAQVQVLGPQGPVAGIPIAWTALSAGAGVKVQQADTDAAGLVVLQGRAGLLAGTHTFRAQAFDLHGWPLPGSPVDLAVDVTPMAAGTILTLLSADPVAWAQTAATLTKTTAVDVAASAAGIVYVAGTCGVLAIDAQGQVAYVVGDGQDCAFSLPTAAAQDARLAPTALALDDGAHKLYVATASRILTVDLPSGGIVALAGGGTATEAPWGDGGSAQAATFADIRALELGNGGLYVADGARNHVRFLASTGTLSTLTIPQADCFWGTGCGAVPAMCWPRDLAWDALEGRLLVSAAACGAGIVGDASAVLAMAPEDPTPTWYAGQSLGVGSDADGTPLQNAVFGMYAGDLALAFDLAGTLHLAVGYSYDARLRKVVGGQVWTVAGILNPQPLDEWGDYGPLSAAHFQHPGRLAFVPLGGWGSLVIIDGGRLRVVW